MMRHKQILLITIALIAIVGGALIWLQLRGDRDSSTSTAAFTNEHSGLKGKYSKELSTTPLTESEKKDNLFLRLENSSKSVLIRFSYEEGLKPLTTITKTDLITTVLSNTEKLLPKTFPSLKIESKREFDLGGHRAAEVVFSYQKPGLDKAKRRLVMINKDDNLVVYVAAETDEASYNEVNDKYFTPLINSLSF
jgi:hypothetical protein